MGGLILYLLAGLVVFAAYYAAGWCGVKAGERYGQPVGVGVILMVFCAIIAVLAYFRDFLGPLGHALVDLFRMN